MQIVDGAEYDYQIFSFFQDDTYYDTSVPLAKVTSMKPNEVNSILSSEESLNYYQQRVYNM